MVAFIACIANHGSMFVCFPAYLAFTFLQIVFFRQVPHTCRGIPSCSEIGQGPFLNNRWLPLYAVVYLLCDRFLGPSRELLTGGPARPTTTMDYHPPSYDLSNKILVSP